MIRAFQALSWLQVRLKGNTPAIPIKIIWVLALLGLTGVIAGWTVFSYPYNISHSLVHSASNLLSGIIFLNLVAGILVLLPLLGWVLTRNHLSDNGQRTTGASGSATDRIG